MIITPTRPEVIARHDVGLTRNGLGNWPDGQLGFRRHPRPDQPVIFAGNGANTALIDFNTGGFHQFPPAAGLPADIGYCSGGPILTNPVDGAWVQFCHTERYPGGNRHAFWGNISLALSRDQAHSWQYLGDIIRPYKPFDLSNVKPCEITGGSVVFSPDCTELRCYFRETLDNYTGRAAVATCNAAEFFNTLADGGLPTFVKYGGDPAVQLNGLPLETDWNSVIWLPLRRQYLMAFCPFGDNGGFKAKGIYLATSYDGFDWTPYSTRSIVSEPGFCYYPNFLTTDDERFVIGNPTLYYMLVQNLDTVWSGMEVHRMTLALN